MAEIKNAQRFAEVERLMSDYFLFHIAPVMQAVQNDLGSKQAEELRSYQRSTAGLLSTMATAAYPAVDTYQQVRQTGEWNSKTTEDYLLMCKEKILGDESMQKDLVTMAGEWRDAVVAEVGREKYDELSAQLGCDLAYAFIDYRVEQLMVDKLVKDNMPKSTAEYIIRKAATSTLFGIERELSQSPLAAEIEARGEAAFNPSRGAKAAGYVLGSAVDAVSLGGVGSWGAFAKFVGVDIAFSAVTASIEKKGEDAMTVEDCISQGVFGSSTNVFDDFRRQSKSIQAGNNDFICATNERLSKKIPTPLWTMDFSNMSNTTPQWTFPWQTASAERDERYKDVPMVVAPGQEEAYLQEQAQMEADRDEQAKEQELQGQQEQEETVTESAGQVSSEAQSSLRAQQEAQSQQTNTSGWGGLLSTVELSGLGDVTKNLGYVISMLPDILVGLFTGKTKSLNISDNLLPIASIVAGMFIKNPILKMLLIGFGGINLLNKAGHEALEMQEGTALTNSDSKSTVASQGQVRYKTYPDEPLNPRIVNPVLRSGSLIATIDNVPCVIALPQNVTDAYNAGALPLNTLANAILAKNDRMQQIAAQNYDESQHETAVRSRGIQ